MFVGQIAGPPVRVPLYAFWKGGIRLVFLCLSLSLPLPMPPPPFSTTTLTLTPTFLPCLPPPPLHPLKGTSPRPIWNARNRRFLLSTHIMWVRVRVRVWVRVRFRVRVRVRVRVNLLLVLSSSCFIPYLPPPTKSKLNCKPTSGTKVFFHSRSFFVPPPYKLFIFLVLVLVLYFSFFISLFLFLYLSFSISISLPLSLFVYPILSIWFLSVFLYF